MKVFGAILFSFFLAAIGSLVYLITEEKRLEEWDKYGRVADVEETVDYAQELYDVIENPEIIKIIFHDGQEGSNVGALVFHPGPIRFYGKTDRSAEIFAGEMVRLFPDACADHTAPQNPTTTISPTTTWTTLNMGTMPNHPDYNPDREYEND